MILTNRGVVIKKKEYTQEKIKEIKSKCTMIPKCNFGDFDQIPIKLYIETDNLLVLPFYFAKEYFCLDLNLVQKKLDNYTQINVFDTDIILRPDQQKVLSVCEQELAKDIGGGILTLGTAFGKTILSLKMFSYFKLKTIVVVNTVQLINQWIDNIRRHIPGARIGILRGTKIQLHDVDIVLATIQSITIKKSITHTDFSTFGMCIIDEIHNIASNVFSSIMFKIRPKLMFGLTATLERKDEMHHLIHYYIGDVIYSNIATNKKQPSIIHVYKYTGASSVEYKLRDQITANVSKMLTNIAQDNERNILLLGIIKELLLDPERYILVISDRLYILHFLNKMIPDSGLIIGKITKEQSEINKQKRVVLGIYKLANEGFNVPNLNTLVFATPRSSIEQSIGRIYRKEHTVVPIIVDIQDSFSLFVGQYYKRMKIYKEKINDLVVIKKN